MPPEALTESAHALMVLHTPPRELACEPLQLAIAPTFHDPSDVPPPLPDDPHAASITAAAAPATTAMIFFDRINFPLLCHTSQSRGYDDIAKRLRH